jgi:glycosyltransferase involved in cell wall biosynthesis
VKISACLIVLNEERNLTRCLTSLAPVVDEIVVVDSGSTDRTVEIARKFGARVVVQPWLGYVAQKNVALDLAAHPWVLSIDADEELSAPLAAAIAQLRADPSADAPGAPNGYQVSRLVFYRGRWIRHGDWYPDRLVRLFRRADARFTGGRVHEKLEIAGDHPILPGDLHHYTYTDPADRTARCATYAALWAQTALEKGRRTWPGIGVCHAALRFVRGYIFKRGFLDGPVGFDVAWGNAREVWLKYHLLRELQASGAVPPA